MNAALAIELELFEPILLSTSEHLQQLHPSQVKWVGIRISPPMESDDTESVTFKADNTRLAIRNLIVLVEQAQPTGTSVLVWYQGRSERFTIYGTGGPVSNG